MEILVPTHKPRLSPSTAYIGVVRTLVIIGFVGYILLFSMIFSEGKVSFPHLQRTLLLVGLSFGGFLLSWRWVRLGGIVLASGMIIALALTPAQLSEWRPWFFGLEGVMALTGILLVLTPRIKV